MQKFIITILLISQITLPIAHSKEREISEQVKQDIELVQSFKGLSKKASGSFITVGGDTLGCQFSNIQDAIDTIPFSGTGEIRIATNKTYNENLIIDDINVSLIGGYSDCFDAGLPFGPSNNQVIINGGDVTSVVKIYGDFVNKTILLRNLRLSDGSGNIAGGGILTSRTDAQILLKNVDIRSNKAQEFGAGIAIIGGEIDLVLQNSRVIDNGARYGAGIYCNSVNSSIIMTENSGVVGNVADGTPFSDFSLDGRGGGLYLDSCDFTLYSGSEDSNFVGINSNFAFGNGGGIYATNGGSVNLYGVQLCNLGTCLGDNRNPAKISENVAGFNYQFGSGGGIYAKSETQVDINGGLIKNNSANAFGGGIMAVDHAQITSIRYDPSCWDDIRCNYFNGNFLHGAPIGAGGAIESHGGAIYSLNSFTGIILAYFEDNVATHGAAHGNGGSEETSSFPSYSSFRSAVIAHNGDDSTESIIYTQGNASITLSYTTIADNNFVNVSSDPVTISMIDNINHTFTEKLIIDSSIIDNFGIPVLRHNTNAFEVDIKCIIANEIASLSSANNLINSSENSPGGAYISDVNPGFKDGNNRDYHLNSQSQAIDYCNNSIIPPWTDIDHHIRGVDDPNNQDLSIGSFYDIGADEYIPVEEVIFENGFE